MVGRRNMSMSTSSLTLNHSQSHNNNSNNKHHHHRTTTGGYGVNNISIVGRKLAMTNDTNKCLQKHSLLSSDFINCPNNSNGSSGSSSSSPGHGTTIPPHIQSTMGRHHNVEIATQVINPSAIGGSLHRRRIIQPFESDDDENYDESLSGRRGKRNSRFNWNKIGCYGISIIVTILVMTGVVLAVGYMQSEKQRLLSRSAKLAQDRNETLIFINEMVPDSPLNITYGDQIFPPTQAESYLPSSGSSSDHSILDSNEEEEEEELQIIEPSEPAIAIHEDDENHDHDHSGVQTEETKMKNDHGHGNDFQIETIVSKQEEEEQLHKLPSEVKVLPPKDFNYKGFSFDIPIYNSSGKDETSFTFQVIPLTTTTTRTTIRPTTPSNFTPLLFENFDDNKDIPIVAKLQTDLFESGSGSSSESDQAVDYDESSTGIVSNSRNKGSRSDTKNGKPPKIKILDRSYTPRPSSINNKYHEKSKTSRPIIVYKPSLIKFNTNDAGIGHHSNTGSASSNGGSGFSYNNEMGGQISVPKNDYQYFTSSSPIPSPPPPTDYTKFDFSYSNPKPTVPTGILPSSGYENFKYDFTTPLAVTLPSTNVDLRFDFNNFATAHGLDLSSFTQAPPLSIGNNIEFDYTKFTTSPPSSPSTAAASLGVNIDPGIISDSQLSKRTFEYQPQPSSYQFDSIGSSSNTNHFAHLLGPQSITNSFGSASPIGASLNLYNFDTIGTGNNNYGSSFGNNEDNTRLAPGTIPLDLASSFIQAGPPGKIYNTNGGNSGGGGFGETTNTFSYNDPTSALGSFNQYNPGSLGSYTSSSGGNTNNQPNYNTITQGMHLLSLLSGNIPNHLLPAYDQQASSSILNPQQDYNLKPEYQIPGLTGYGGSTSNSFLSGLNTAANTGNYNPYLLQPQPGESRSISQSVQPSYTGDYNPIKKFPADQEGSFSQNIISKLNQFGNKINGQESTSSSIRNGKSLTLSFASSPSSTIIPKLPSTMEDHGPTLDILGIRALLNKFIESGSTMSTKSDGSKLEDTLHAPPTSQTVDKSKPAADMVAAASENIQSQLKKPDIVEAMASSPSPTVNVEFGRKLLLKTTSQNKRQEEDKNFENQKSEKGLKSGFYI